MNALCGRRRGKRRRPLRSAAQRGRHQGTGRPAVDCLPERGHTRRNRRVVRRRGSGLGYTAVSGNLVLFDFDDVETMRHSRNSQEQPGWGSVGAHRSRLPGSLTEWTARRSAEALSSPVAEASPRQHEADTIKTKIETKAEGGYVVVAPSTGRVHPSAASWRRGVDRHCRGSRAVRRRSCPSTNCRTEPRKARIAAFTTGRPATTTTGAVTVPAQLEKHGWRVYLFERNGVAHLRRPGKEQGTFVLPGRRRCATPLRSKMTRQPCCSSWASTSPRRL